jgi:hypothetical protein
MIHTINMLHTIDEIHGIARPHRTWCWDGRFAS